MKKYALIGKNIQGSLSPVIHNGYGCEYDLLDVDEDELEEVLKLKYDGFNVTSPYKEKIVKFLDNASDQPVNTIVRRDGLLLGFNTDLIGFLEALQIVNVSYMDKIGILGNGAMAKLINRACPNSIMIDSYNYDPKDFSTLKGLVNCTPKQNYNLFYLHKNSWVMDLGYQDDTFIKSARANGNFAFNGMNMLIGQAREAQAIWNNL